LPALAVPTEAVIRTGKRSLVMLADHGSFRPVEVTLGREIGDRTVIASGLAEGQQVVASGQFLLDSEASLQGFGLPTREQDK
jgi:Cu(I)/Ag(I) efflux system membrane fusion protein